MKLRVFIILVFISVSFFAVSKEKPCTPVKNIPENQRAYDHGENLVYVINYKWGLVNTDVGEAVVNLYKKRDSSGGEYFHSVINGYTYKFYDVFFKVRDLFESKFSTKNGRPFYFHRDIHEGKYRMKNTFHFQPDYSIKAKVERKSDPVIDTLLPGRECTFDLVSLFYFSRNIDFTHIPAGVEQPISFAIDNEIFDLYYRLIGPEIKRIPGMGQFRTLKFAARVVAGEVFSGKEELVIWVTDDKNRVPLMFETPIQVGRVVGTLSSFRNLKYPLTSKIR
jgi:hypothetical protein